MVASLLYLIASLWGAWFSWNALFPRRRGVYLSSWSFAAGWLTSDLALHHIAWQAAATAVFWRFGAFSAPPGRLGLAVTAASWTALLWSQLRALETRQICEAALREALGDDYRDEVAARGLDDTGDRRIGWKRLLFPLPKLPANAERVRNIRYSRAAGLDLHLDVYRPRSADGSCPVLFQIHGGAWVVDNKDHQAMPLMHRLAECGWVCVSIDYRLSPHATFPEHMIDVKRALRWVKENIATYGGDPNFVIATGGSAGGHLSALATLTANDPEYQPGFEHIDTTVQGCVAFYGVYDFTGATEEHDGQAQLLEKYVMKGSRSEIADAYHRASPVKRIDENAPPLFVLHGDCDTLVPVSQARGFVRELRARTASPVAFAELPGAQHAFEIFHTVRSIPAVEAALRFATVLHRRHQSERTMQKERPRLRAV